MPENEALNENTNAEPNENTNPETAPATAVEPPPPTTPTPEEINARNAKTSTGRLSDDGKASPFYTAADVRAMSAEEVRANYERIMISMRSGKF
ncbi:MAG: hypothetical protein ACLR5G_14025 [Eubacteriales bacterium]